MRQTNPSAAPPSRSQVNRVSKAVRAYERAAPEERTPELRERYVAALATLAAYRAQFARPLLSVNMSLRSFVATLSIDAAVTQRLKREETIRDKFHRHPTMQLANMQDIGGCRVVVPGEVDVRRLERHIDRRWGERVLGRDDYIREPRQSGYRALHVVAERMGYPIEIQIRTLAMHQWAQTVESFSGHYSVNYKQDGSSDVQQMMQALSRLDQADEQGVEPAQEDLTLLRTMAERVQNNLQSLAPGAHEGTGRP